ncbi:MAG: hypothetical protein K8L91_03210 [Anaerolineae bacterium]|nr:hypothetical protein [Anaerolineae bacterium]
MTAIDSCEPQIIRALEKDGWQIVDKPFPIFADKRPVLADFSAHRSSEHGDEFIVVIEVKCFTDPRADLSEFYSAIGQYWYYKVMMTRDNVAFRLYLALPLDAYTRFQLKPSFLQTFEAAQVKLVVVDIGAEVIEQWINWQTP